MFFDIFIILLLVCANGFFVAAEFAIVKVRATQIETSLDPSSHRARIAKEIIGHLDAYLSATQLGITLTSIGLGWIGEPAVSRMMLPLLDFFQVTSPQAIHTISFAVGFSTITFLHITLGELAPKSAAIQYPTGTTLLISYPLRLFYLIFKPIISMLNDSANLMLRGIGIRAASGDELGHSEEEIRLLLAHGQKSGVIDATEYRLIENIFDFTETSVKEIMVPRTGVFALDLDKPFEENLKDAVESGYTRIPVFKEDIDHIVGILYMKDILRLEDKTKEVRLESILRAVHFTPETTSISRLMQNFMQQRFHMAVVIDEFGGTSGILTLENILEKIVGQIQDEYDEEKSDVESQSDGSFLVASKIRVEEFNRAFQANIPQDQDYETLGGFLNDQAGHIPHMGEEIRYGNLTFKVTRKSPKQVQQVRVIPGGSTQKA